LVDAFAFSLRLEVMEVDLTCSLGVLSPLNGKLDQNPPIIDLELEG